MAYVAGTVRPGVNTDVYGNNYVTNYYGNASDGLGDVYIPEIFSRKMLK